MALEEVELHQGQFTVDATTEELAVRAAGGSIDEEYINQRA
jgi:hypothetical protein